MPLYNPAGSGSPTGSASGDLSGTYPGPTVAQVQGVAVTSAEATLVSDLNNATARTATATLLPGEETIFSGSTASQTLTLPASPPSSSVNTVTNAASVSVTLAPGAGATLSNFGTTGNVTIPSGYTFAVVYIGTTWYVQNAGPSDFAVSSALAVANGGTGAATASAALANLGGVPQSRTQPVSGGNAQKFAQWTVIPAGDTDTLGNFSSIFGAHTVSSVLTTPWFLGYNVPDAPTYNAVLSSIYMDFFPDAGDTAADEFALIAAGGSANGSWSVTPIFIVAKRDSTATVDVTLACGTGSASQIALNDSAGNNYLLLGPAWPNVTTYKNLLVTPVSGVAAFTVQPQASNTNAQVIVAATGSGVAEIILGNSGTNWWLWYGRAANLQLIDEQNGGRTQVTYTPGASAVAALTEFGSQVKVDSSLIVGTAALATTATDGFLYLPSCAGAPTGVPTAKTGTVACVLDTTDNQLWIYNGAWKAVTLS